MKQQISILLVGLVSLSAILACGESTERRAIETAVVEAEQEQEVVAGQDEPTNPPDPTSTPEPASTSEPTSTPEPTPTPEPTSTPEPTPTPILGLVRIGTHIVGEDIQPGIYWGLAGEDLFDSCYWARLSDLAGELSSIIANDNAIGQYYVELRETDFALKTACELILLEHAPIREVEEVLTPGTYIIGRDIQPGRYQGQAGEEITETCYWSRLKDVSGSFESIIANDNAMGSYYIQVFETDFALNTACPLERVGD